MLSPSGPCVLAWPPAQRVWLPGPCTRPPRRRGQDRSAAPQRSSLGEAGATSEAPQTPRSPGPCKPRRDRTSAWDTPWSRDTKASNTVLGHGGTEEHRREELVLALHPCRGAVIVKSPSRPGRVLGIEAIKEAWKQQSKSPRPPEASWGPARARGRGCWGLGMDELTSALPKSPPMSSCPIPLLRAQRVPSKGQWGHS